MFSKPKLVVLPAVWPVGLFLCPVIVSLGCANTRDYWKECYYSLSPVQYPPTSGASIVFSQVEYEKLDGKREAQGYELLGVSQFRSGLSMINPSAFGSSLRAHASSVGADYVRWAERVVGTQGYAYKGTGSVYTIADYLVLYYRRLPLGGE